MNADIVKLYLDTLLEEKPEDTPEDKICRALGVDVVKKMVSDLVAHRISMVFSDDKYKNYPEKIKQDMLAVQLEAWTNLIKKAHIDECLKCEDLFSCAPYKRLMSSILIPQTGPLCDKFDKAFRTTWDNIMKKAAGEAKEEKHEG